MIIILNKGELIMAKTFSFALIHFTVAFTVGYLLTGSILFGSAMAMIEPAINTVAFHIHEKVWQRFQREETSASGISMPV